MHPGELITEVDTDRPEIVDDPTVRGLIFFDRRGVPGLRAYKRGRPVGTSRWRGASSRLEYGIRSNAECARRCGGPCPRRNCVCGFYAVAERDRVPTFSGCDLLEVALAGVVHVYRWQGGGLLLLGARQLVTKVLAHAEPGPLREDRPPYEGGGLARLMPPDSQSPGGQALSFSSADCEPTPTDWPLEIRAPWPTERSLAGRFDRESAQPDVGSHTELSRRARPGFASGRALAD